MEESCILLRKLMNVNVDTALLWLIMIAKYIIKKYKMKRSNPNSFIFYKRNDNGNL